MNAIIHQDLAIRHKVLVVPTVSCVNRVVEMVERVRPDVSVLTHQHGCGMFDNDVAALAAMLSATASHPHVGAAVLVSLGCESNQPQFALSRIADAVPTRVVRFQDQAGHADAVDEVLRQLDCLEPRFARLATDLAGLRVGVAVEYGSAISDSRLPADLTRELARAGAVVDGPRRYTPGAGRSSANSLPEMAAAAGQTALDGDAQTVSALVANGCHMVIVMGNRPGPLGSPVAPVVTVTGDGAWAAIADVAVSGTDGEGAVEAVLSALRGVVAGALTLGERARVRTLSVRRIAMTM